MPQEPLWPKGPVRWRSKIFPYLVAGVVAVLCLWLFWQARPGTPLGMSSVGVGQPTNPKPPDTAILEWGLKLVRGKSSGAICRPK